MDLKNYEYYVRLTALYRSAYVKIDGLTGQNTTSNGVISTDLYFDNVQPAIDVTGRVNNTYRRLIARVAPTASLARSLFFPEYAIESGSIVCKKMIVNAPGAGNSSDLCDYSN
jgi:hypothetical protein